MDILTWSRSRDHNKILYLCGKTKLAAALLMAEQVTTKESAETPEKGNPRDGKGAVEATRSGRRKLKVKRVLVALDSRNLNGG